MQSKDPLCIRSHGLIHCGGTDQPEGLIGWDEDGGIRGLVDPLTQLGVLLEVGREVPEPDVVLNKNNLVSNNPVCLGILIFLC